MHEAMKKILILCTGNSCRSQMAEGFLNSLHLDLEVCSAGTEPALSVHPEAVAVMAEKGIDISRNHTKDVALFRDKTFDYVITVCAAAREKCPVFTGALRHGLHMGFDDQAGFMGSTAEIREEFRRVRDEIMKAFYAFQKSLFTGKAGLNE